MKPLESLTPQELETLAGEYVLGTLGEAERRQVRAGMDTHPALARSVAAWEARLQPLTGLAEPIAPPQRLWARIEQTLGIAPRQPAWRAPWNSLRLWRVLAASASACAIVLATLLASQPAGQAPRFLVVLVAPQDKAPGWVIQASDPHSVQLIPLGAFEVPAGKALEFWTKGDSWNAPVSLGLIRPGQQVRIPLGQLPTLQPNQLFELTLEPATGSPTGRPTGPIQFIGRAVPVT
jgi:anti-sigma-K factor RskA